MYGSLADADAYHAARDNAAWIAVTPDAAMGALQRASDYIDRTYERRFTGARAGGRNQAQAWPRLGATDAAGEAIPASEVPQEVEWAVYEAALAEIGQPGLLSPVAVDARRVTSERVSSISVTYADAGGLDGLRPQMAVVEGLLAGLLARSRAGIGAMVV